MWASRFGAARIQRKRMLFQCEAFGFRYSVLALFNLGIVKLFDTPAIEAHQMIVMRALIELVYRLAALKIAAREQAGLLKLREHAIHRGQADISALVEQNAIHIFRRHMPQLAGLENLHDFQARQRGFEAGVFEFVKRGHDVRESAGQPLQWNDHNLHRPQTCALAPHVAYLLCQFLLFLA